MSLSALRRLIGCAPLAACLAGCAISPQLTPVTIEPGCYTLTADGWPREVAQTTGLTGLPSFVGLDTAVAGPAGRRVMAPRSWAGSSARAQHVYWTEELHGNRQASLLLTFAGPTGNLVASLEAERDGYAGPAAVGGKPGTPGVVPQMRITLLAIGCVGLRLEAEAQEP